MRFLPELLEFFVTQFHILFAIIYAITPWHRLFSAFTPRLHEVASRDSFARKHFEPNKGPKLKRTAKEARQIVFQKEASANDFETDK